MAPQRLKGATADARSDIWATGVMFYELLGYRRPFKAKMRLQDVDIILEEPRSILEAAPGTPEDVKAISRPNACKEVEARYQTMKEVLLELEPAGGVCWNPDISVLPDNSRRSIRTAISGPPSRDRQI